MIILEVQSRLQARTCPVIVETKVAQQDGPSLLGTAAGIVLLKQ